MTKQDRLDLYEELRSVLFVENRGALNLTPAQEIFANAFEGACFQTEFLNEYSALVDKTPNITIRNLHAFCLGYALGTTFSEQLVDDENQTTH